MKSIRQSPAALSAIEVVFEDDDIIVLNKPSGLLVLPDRYNLEIPSLQTMLGEKYGRIYVVHRIDRGTSGLIIFAKTVDSHRLLNAQFESRDAEKVYQAICIGESRSEEGMIDVPIAEDPKVKGGMRVDRKEGKLSVTAYKVIEQFAAYSHIEVRPETGRTHQIRVHLSSIGLPILGDLRYGGGESFFLSSIKPTYRSTGEEKPLLNRTALHAEKMSITHPTSARRMSFEVPIPKDMRIVLNYLRKFRGR